MSIPLKKKNNGELQALRQSKQNPLFPSALYTNEIIPTAALYARAYWR
jgi:hypothetical protein